MLRLHQASRLAQGYHRSGWPYVLGCLERWFDPAARVVLDDVAERTFTGARQPPHVHRDPWVGVLHVPPGVPAWYLPQPPVERLLDEPRFRESLETARLFVSMGPNLTEWLRRVIPGVAVAELRLATDLEVPRFSPERLLANPQPLLLQVGWFLRDTSAIYRIEAPSWLTRAHLRGETRWGSYAHWVCEKHARNLGLVSRRPDEVKILSRVADADYDVLLSQNVVFVDLIGAVANTTVVECIARATPIVVNRMAGPVAYLGSEYPLFYDDPAELPELLSQERVIRAHEYLKRLDVRAVSGETFVESFASACRVHVPELGSLR